MTNQEIKESAKAKITEYLSLKGINYKNNFTCLNPLHEDKHPSMSYDSKRQKVHCFACGADYDIFDLVSLDTGLTGADLFNHVYRMYNLEKDIFYVGKDNEEKIEDLTSFFAECHKNISLTDYWQKRGLSKKTIDKYNIGYWKEKDRLVIPTGKNSYNARAINCTDKKQRYLKPKGQYSLFNLEIIGKEKEPVFIVEGELDALSIIECGACAVALGSSGSRKLIDYLKQNKPLFPLIISLDNDKAGEEGSKKLLKELEDEKIDCICQSLSVPYKDANEALVNNRAELEKAIEDAKKKALCSKTDEYLKKSAAYGLETFIEDIKVQKKNCISTGFNSLDEALDGGFYTGLYIIGAVSSLGKTTLALQTCDQAANRGQDVLVFSLEMTKKELIAKSVSRLSFQKCKSLGSDLTYATTTRSLLNGASLKSKNHADFLSEVVADYSQSASHVFYQTGMGDITIEDIRKSVEKHIGVTGNKPLVIVDYLQIIAPIDMRAGDKQNTDRAVVELKKISLDFDIPVVVISSFNRESYSGPVTLSSFKESGAIEYTSDVLMALQAKGMDYEKKEDGRLEDEKSRSARILKIKEKLEENAEIPGKAQSLELKILKNRNGRRASVDLNFYPMFNTFEEVKKQRVAVSSVSSDGWVLRSSRKRDTLIS